MAIPATTAGQPTEAHYCRQGAISNPQANGRNKVPPQSEFARDYTLEPRAEICLRA